ncbi:MAG: restriction endonuclease subunit S, partial [Aeromonas allosaccharophila]
MSAVNFLDKLLDGVVVEWKALGEIGYFVRGKRFVKSDILSEGIPCIHYGEMYTHFGISAKETRSFLDADLASKLRFANHGDVIIVAAGETIEDIGNGTAWVGDCDVVIHDACFSYKSTLDPTYVSYFLRTKSFKKQIKKYVSSGKISSINSTGLGKAIIPIPCPDNAKKSLEIQAEIVRILDTFTELTYELTYELTARKKQYNHYRDQLLNSEDRDVEWKTLGSLVDINTGSKPPEILESATSFDYINAGTSRSGYSEASNCSGDTVTTPSRGQGGIGYVGYQNKPFWLGPLCYKLRSTDLTVLINKYLFYFLQSRNEMLLG